MSSNIKVVVGEKERTLREAIKAFKDRFGYVATKAAAAPGRVNLIGEHTDYNRGFVLPMAIPLYTVVVGKPSETGICRISTLSEFADHPKDIEFSIPKSGSIENALLPGHPKWANYVKGVMANYKGSWGSFDALINTSVPIGGGLSSSASLEVAIYTFLDAINPTLKEEEQISLTTKALNCQKAEHDFALMPCGIMDQFIAFMGKEGHALLIDCESLESRLVPIASKDISILITNSNVRHELTGSEYSSRRTTCEQAALQLGKESLRDVNISQLEFLKQNDEMFRRARHVITEIARTQKAANSLGDSDFDAFGRLMNASHLSLRDDFEVSVPELDELVRLSQEVEGVYGSRMTGGGFGGCTVTLLKRETVQTLIEHITRNYSGKAHFYVCSPADGAHIVQISG